MIIGHVGQDPEVRYTGNASNGAKVATLRVATSERYKDKDGNVKEQTEWHSIVCWRQLADIVEKYVKKGTQLYVEGKLVTRSWEDQNGGKKSITEIVADSIQLLDKKQDSQSAPAPQERTPLYQQETPQRFNSTPLPVDDGDLPEGDGLPFS